jgi:hypothetical protein
VEQRGCLGMSRRRYQRAFWAVAIAFSHWWRSPPFPVRSPVSAVEDAAALTGQTLVVDGGLVLG